MSTVLDDVVATIHGAGYATLGVSLFQGEMPDEPSLCVAVLDAGGGGPRLGLGDVVLWDETMVQILVRGATHAPARALAETIYQGFLEQYSSTLNSVAYLQAAPVAPVSYVDRDAEDRPLFALTLRCWRMVP